MRLSISLSCSSWCADDRASSRTSVSFMSFSWSSSFNRTINWSDEFTSTSSQCTHESVRWAGCDCLLTTTTYTNVIRQKAESLTPHLHSLCNSIGLTDWPRLAIPCFSGRFVPQNLSEVKNTIQHIRTYKCTCQMTSKSFERFKQGVWMWQTTDQPDHARENV